MVSTSFVSAAMAMLAVASVDAHSKLIKPAPHYKNPGGANSPSGLIQGNSVLKPPAGKSFSTDPDSNAAAFVEAMKTSKYKSLKELVLQTQKVSAGASAECGFADLAGATPQPLPDMVEWDEFTSSHTGPCEVWCDNELAFQDNFCSKNFKGNPAKLPYQKAKCAGAKVLTSYWIALHTAEWQVYTGCAPLSGASAGGGGGGGAAANSTTGGNGNASGNAGGNAGGNSGRPAGGNNGGNAGRPAGGNTGGNAGGNSGGAVAGDSDSHSDHTSGNADGNASNGGNSNNAGGNDSNAGGNSNTSGDTNAGGNNNNTGGNNNNTGGNGFPPGGNNNNGRPAGGNNNNNNNNGRPAGGNGWGGWGGNNNGGNRGNAWGNFGGNYGGAPNAGNVRTGW